MREMRPALNCGPQMKTDVPSTTTSQFRCAIYTRKSTEEGLDQDFNSLDAQREAAEAFIRSQRGEGLVALPERYDDGGFTGGNMDRPALERLLADIRGGQGRLRGRLQGGPAEPVADRLRPHHRDLRKAQRQLRFGNAAVQHDQLPGPPDAQHPVILRPVRAGDHLRAHARQDVGGKAQGQMDRRASHAGLRHRPTRQSPDRQRRRGHSGTDDLSTLPRLQLTGAGSSRD